MKLFAFLISFLLLAHFTFSCLPLNRKSETTPPYNKNRKYLDMEYVTQLDRMTRCLAELPSHVYQSIPQFTKEWSESALKSVAGTLIGTKDPQDLYKRGFIDCFEIVAEQRVKRFICTAFELLEGELDKMEQYAVAEYLLCVDEKNKPYKKHLIFKMPQIGAVRQKPKNK